MQKERLMQPLVLNEKSEATYQSYKNKEIEWYMCDLSKVLKLLIAIDLSIEHEINDYNNQPKPDEESNESGILEGRYEFALQLWNIINKGGSNE
tara:strand:+ start:89 stop:370 length:282 start_codon:yes stop_codon:yes gene_type:complete